MEEAFADMEFMVDLAAISSCDSPFCIRYAQKSDFFSRFLPGANKSPVDFRADLFSKSTVFYLKLIVFVAHMALLPHINGEFLRQSPCVHPKTGYLR